MATCHYRLAGQPTARVARPEAGDRGPAPKAWFLGHQQTSLIVRRGGPTRLVSALLDVAAEIAAHSCSRCHCGRVRSLRRYPRSACPGNAAGSSHEVLVHIGAPSTVAGRQACQAIGPESPMPLLTEQSRQDRHDRNGSNRDRPRCSSAGRLPCVPFLIGSLAPLRRSWSDIRVLLGGICFASALGRALVESQFRTIARMTIATRSTYSHQNTRSIAIVPGAALGTRDCLISHIPSARAVDACTITPRSVTDQMASNRQRIASAVMGTNSRRLRGRKTSALSG